MNTNEVLSEKIRRLEQGQRVVVSDADLDALSDNNICHYLATIPNPQQCGTLDCWVAFLKTDRK